MRAAIHTDGMCCTPHLQAPHHRDQKMKATLLPTVSQQWHIYGDSEHLQPLLLMVMHHYLITLSPTPLLVDSIISMDLYR